MTKIKKLNEKSGWVSGWVNNVEDILWSTYIKIFTSVPLCAKLCRFYNLLMYKLYSIMKLSDCVTCFVLNLMMNKTYLHCEPFNFIKDKNNLYPVKKKIVSL